MAQDDPETPDSHDTFDLPRWHHGCGLWLDFCEQYWGHFRREREAARLRGPHDEGWGGPVPYREIENRYGRRLPAVARAAAGLRRSLALAVEQLLPEAGVTGLEDEDTVERAMAGSQGWEEAVGLALADVDRMKELLARARPEWGVTAATDIQTLVELLRGELERQVRSFEALARPRLARLSTEPLTRTGYTRVPADRINKAIIEALAPGAMKELPAGYFEMFGPGARFWRAYAFDTGRRPPGYDQLVGVVGLREEPDESQWRLLRRSSALAVKIHLALWERAYMEAAVDGPYGTKLPPRPCDYVATTVARLCDDIGLTRKKGAHKRESREAAVGLLELITSLELVCVYKPPRNVPPETLRGPVWRRGLVPTDLSCYADLFAPEAGGHVNMAPRAFSFAPGHYFENPTWRTHNRYVAFVNAALLGASCRNQHRWEVMVGAYLSILARMNGYRRTRLSLGTLAEKSGLLEVYEGQSLIRMHDLLEEALDRLKEAGVIRHWDWETPENDGGGEGKSKQTLHSQRAVASRKKSARGLRGAQKWGFNSTLFVDWPEAMAERGRRLSQKRKKKRKVKLDLKGREQR